MSKVELELEDVATVVVHLIAVEMTYLVRRSYVEARRTHNIAAKLADKTDSRLLREYVAEAQADRARLYPLEVEAVGT